MLLRDFVPRCARAFAAHPAFIHGGTRRSWREMHERSERLAAALQGLGLRKGQTSAILAHNRIELAEHWFACLKLGAARAGINWRYSLAEMLHAIRDSDTRVLIVEADCLGTLGNQVDELLKEGRLLVGFGPGHGLPLDYETLLARHDRADLPPLDGGDRAMIAYTSGSTGLPKGVILSQRALYEGTVHNVLVNRYAPADVRLYTTNPAGLNIYQMCFNVACGMTTVVDDFDTQRSLELMAEHRVTQITVVPTMLRRMIDEVKKGGHDLSALRQVAYGTMPTTPALIREAYDTLACTFIQRYGVSESSGAVAALRDDDHRAALDGDAELLTSVGRPMLHAEISVRDDDGRSLPTGELGTVWIRSETLMDGYLNNPGETAEALRTPPDRPGETWLRTGDFGRMDERGYIFLGDRRKNMIISGGMNVYPLAVENALAEHAAVKEVAVIGIPHREWGEAVVAAVSLAPGARCSPEELLRHCRDRVAKFEVPKHVVILDRLPQGHTDKINKRALRDQLIAQRAVPWSLE